MKTIVEINSNNYGSTGNIALNIAKTAREFGYNVITCFKPSREAKKRKNEDQIFIGNWLDRVISERLAYYTGLKDHFNIINTLLFINKLKKIKPDLIHLHVLHDSYINTKILFAYIKKNDIPVIWTFHDEWAFTGKCTTFELSGCNKWQTGCGNCPKLHEAPSSFLFDFSKHNWKRKKELFDYNKLKIVTPSIWLRNLLKDSFLKDANTMVINNGINLEIFKPTNNLFREKYGLKDKTILLGVASYWGERKGLDVFIQLASDLSDKYQIVLIGTDDNVDKLLPNNIISIHRTFNQQELADIYSSADLFLNPTREDNLPTVNIEAIACGTPVLTYNTGGSIEIIDKDTGDYVERNDYKSLLNKITIMTNNKTYTKEKCVRRASQFDMRDKFNEYVKLYDSILNNCN